MLEAIHTLQRALTEIAPGSKAIAIVIDKEDPAYWHFVYALRSDTTFTQHYTNHLTLGEPRDPNFIMQLADVIIMRDPT